MRSIKDEGPDQMIPLGERHFRRSFHEFVAHYHGERSHQRVANELIDAIPSRSQASGIRRRQRLGGLLNYYCRAA